LKVNQQYIADLLKISRVTVTKALQEHPDIAKSTVKKVKEVADELGYIPNIVGRSLSTKKTNTIGVVVPKINHSFFSTIIEEMYTKAKDLGYQIILMVSFENEESELANVKSLLSMNVDGIIIDSVSTSAKDKSYELILKHQKPLIYIDRKPRSIKKVESIVFDDYNLSYKLTNRLIDKGYKDIMYITGSQEINICYDRLSGFKAAMKESNLGVSKGAVLNAGLDKQGSFDVFEKYVESNSNLPEAIVCVNDSVALGVYDVCKKHGIKIPDDIGVIGFGHVSVSNLVQPPLSTVKLNLQEASFVAVENLVAMINDQPYEKNNIIDGEIIFRESIK
jgi:DNA-binding LacI/PurR family transcriptional regulator